MTPFEPLYKSSNRLLICFRIALPQHFRINKITLWHKEDEKKNLKYLLAHHLEPKDQR